MSHPPTFKYHQRSGAALILVCILLGLVFVAVAFSVDIARLQLTQLELQSTADLSSRAGAEAIARGVAPPNDNGQLDDRVRKEINMIAEMNRAGGLPIVFDEKQEVTFGSIVTSGGAPTFLPTANGKADSLTEAVQVNANVVGFPFIFGSFVATQDVNLGESGAAMVEERDIVLVLDRSTSMMKYDAGLYDEVDYNSNLRNIQEDLYLIGDSLHPDTPDGMASSSWHTEFEESGGNLTLSRTQALKLAVLRFRETVNDSRGAEQLGLVTYSSTANLPAQATSAPGPVDIITGLTSATYSAVVGNGITTESEKYASALESASSEYNNFDFNYLAMRWRPGTNIADGIEKGVQVLFGTGRRPFAKPILIVMTDGQHNQNGTPEASATAAMLAHPNLRIHAVTFGVDADIAKMQTVAAIGKGTHHHAANVNDLLFAFVTLAKAAGVTLVE